MTEIEARICDSFVRQSLMATFKARVETVAPGSVTVIAPITDAVLQQQGVAHAEITFGLGDTAAGYAALTRLDGAKS